MSETQQQTAAGAEKPCRFCKGSGTVLADRCAEIVHGRPCRNPIRNDPGYYEKMPERAWVRPYCGMHGNLRLRAALAASGAEGTGE